MAFGIEGVLVGHARDQGALTGCTVIILPPGSKGGCDIRGGAPGTRETDLLRPVNIVDQVNAFVLSGGSAFGLAAADGVMRYLEERDLGFETIAARVPIVPAAVIFDLMTGDPGVRPDAERGYEACLNASEAPEGQGNVGAGTGATVGMILGTASWMKSGLGMAGLEREDGLCLFALAVVNAVGDVIDEDGSILAGARNPQGGFLDTEAFMAGGPGFPDGIIPGTNTTLAVFVSNADLSKTETNWVARQGHNGIARAVRPSHTKHDGDSVFAASTGKVAAQPDLVGILAARLVAEAIRNAVRHAESVDGIPASP
jgi:L-aminopeptidase/D-esterase-like protein